MKEKNNGSLFLKIVAIVTACLIFILIAVFAVLYFLNRKPAAAFYGISDKTREVIEKNLQGTVKTREGKKAYEIVVLDDSIPLSDALKKVRKIDILFIHDGLNATYAYEIVRNKNLGFVKDEVLSGMTSSIRQTAPDYKEKKYVENIPQNLSEEQRAKIAEENRLYNKVSAIPMLLDNYEIDVKFANFNDSKVGSVNYWKDLEKLSEYNKKVLSSPVLYAGGDDRELINIVGALTESLSGLNEWKKAVSEIEKSVASGGNSKKNGKNLVEVAETLVSEGNSLYPAIDFLRNWKANGYLPRNVNQLSKRDLAAYANAEETGILFMNLETHRTYKDSVIGKYRSIYFPSDYGNQYRNFTAPVIMALSLSKNESCRGSVKLLCRNLQEKLSFGTGLAPALANCGVPDKQADDARYWVAATEKPLPALSDAAFLSDSQRTVFASIIRSAIEKR